MAVDLQVVFPQMVISLSKIRTVRSDRIPRTLEIVGEDFSSVDEVLINDHPSPDVVVVSNTKLWAQVPDQLRLHRITSVTVLSNTLVLNNKSLIRFRIGPTPGKIRGILRLVQLFLKLLFTTPGSDIFSPSSGGGALQQIGRTFGKDQGGSIVSNFIISVDNTKRQIVAIQGRQPRLPPDERLLTARVLSVGFNRNEAALLATIEITSQAGRAAKARVEL